jgi:hypothetical protein
LCEENSSLVAYRLIQNPKQIFRGHKLKKNNENFGTRELTNKMGLFQKRTEHFFPRLDISLKCVRNYMAN